MLLILEDEEVPEVLVRPARRLHLALEPLDVFDEEVRLPPASRLHGALEGVEHLVLALDDLGLQQHRLLDLELLPFLPGLGRGFREGLCGLKSEVLARRERVAEALPQRDLDGQVVRGQVLVA